MFDNCYEFTEFACAAHEVQVELHSVDQTRVVAAMQSLDLRDQLFWTGCMTECASVALYFIALCDE